MKVIVSNKFYYPRGGDCVCTINLEELLKQKGHEVAVFSMQHPENLETPWSKYFPSEVKFAPGLGIIEALRRSSGIVLHFVFLLTALAVHVVILIHNSNF